jgi:hypothetical protein
MRGKETENVNLDLTTGPKLSFHLAASSTPWRQSTTGLPRMIAKRFPGDLPQLYHNSAPLPSGTWPRLTLYRGTVTYFVFDKQLLLRYNYYKVVVYHIYTSLVLVLKEV